MSVLDMKGRFVNSPPALPPFPPSMIFEAADDAPGGVKIAQSMRPYFQRVMILLNGQRGGKIVGRSLPYIDKRTGTPGVQLYDVLLDGDELPILNIPDAIVYDEPEARS